MVVLASLFGALCFAAGAFSADLLMVEGLTAQEFVQAQAAGFTIDTVSKDIFNTMTTAQFSTYKAIVIGDPYCGDVSNINFLNTNRDVWSSAVTGNVLIMGTDASFHSGIPGAKSLMTNSIKFAASEAGETGLYISMSCYFTQTPVSALLYFGTFNMEETYSCDVHIVASSPALGTLADSDIQNWGCSVHEKFTAYPSSGSNPFLPLAIVRGEPGAVNFGDGSAGVPYILARGATPAGCGDGIWQPALGEQCDNGPLNDQPGNECSLACRCVSGLPDEAGHCLAPATTSSSSSSSSSSTSSSSSSTSSSSSESSSSSSSSSSESSSSSSSESSTSSSTSSTSTPEITTTTSTTEASTTAASTTEEDDDDDEDESTTQESSTETSTTTTGPASTEATSTESSTESSSSTPVSSMTPTSSSTVDETSSTTSTLFPSDTTSETSSSLETSAPTDSESSSTTTSSLEFSESFSETPSFTDLDPSSTTTFRFFNTSRTSILDSETSEMSSMTSSAAGSESLATSLSTTTISSTVDTGPLTTPSSASTVDSSVTSSLVSTSSTEALPSTTPSTPTPPGIQATFIIQVVFTLRTKRQVVNSFAMIDAAGNVEITTSCLQASLVSITADSRMISNSLFARALPAGIAAGSELFTFASPQAGEVDTTFLISGRDILWNNVTFGNGNAVFAINPTTRLVEVFYSGAPPLNYQTITFRAFFGETVVEACAALAGGLNPSSTITTTPLGTASVPATTSPASLTPVGIEIVIYVIIQTVIVGGETICLTDSGKTSTNYIYRSAVPGLPCYACLLASQDIECPNDEKNKFTIVTSSCTEPNSALFTAKPSPVYNPCPTCAATTLRGAAITPVAAVPENLAGFSPVNTATIGGGVVVYGSKSVDGQLVSAALAVPANAPYAIGAPPAPPQAAKPAGDAKPVGIDYTNGGYNPRPVQVDTPGKPPVDSPGQPPFDSPGKPPVDVGTKSAEAPPPVATQPIKPVLSGSAPSFVNCLTLLHFMLLVIII